MRTEEIAGWEIKKRKKKKRGEIGPEAYFLSIAATADSIAEPPTASTPFT